MDFKAIIPYIIPIMSACITVISVAVAFGRNSSKAEHNFNTLSTKIDNVHEHTRENFHSLNRNVNALSESVKELSGRIHYLEGYMNIKSTHAKH